MKNVKDLDRSEIINLDEKLEKEPVGEINDEDLKHYLLLKNQGILR